MKKIYRSTALIAFNAIVLFVLLNVAAAGVLRVWHEPGAGISAQND
ncbi:MAG: hypothetical protein IPJ01_12875, partial [Micavibrio sp.]|nr:hypothetical protein [Micavibrio sp.]